MELRELSGTAGVAGFPGEVTGEITGELEQVYSKLIEKKYPAAVLDFSGTNHIDSTGIARLIKFSVAVNQSGTMLLAAGLDERYRGIFRLTGLSDAITAISDAPAEIPWLDRAAAAEMEKILKSKIEQSDYGWATYTTALDSSMMPEEALNRNVHGRKVQGPLRGFGPMWEKTYELRIEKPGLEPAGLVGIMKERLPEFQPKQNRFYTSPAGIEPGEVVLIDSITPGGVVSTGVMVLYADETGFSLITPQGHPEAGWVTFSAGKRDKASVFRIQGLASAGDPVYEAAFRLAGSKFQETIWKHVLASLADYLETPRDITVEKKVVNPSLHWDKVSNLWYNAQFRSLPLNFLPRAWQAGR